MGKLLSLGLVAALVLVLAGCKIYRYKHSEKTAKDGVVSRDCEAESKGFMTVTEIQALVGSIPCNSDRNATFGAQGIKQRGDTEFAKGVTEAAVSAAIKAAPKPPGVGALTN